MANSNHTATPDHAPAAIRPTPKFEAFHSSLCGDIFRTQSLLEAARVMLAQQVVTDDGPGMHLDDVLLEVNDKLVAVVDKLNAALGRFETISQA